MRIISALCAIAMLAAACASARSTADDDLGEVAQAATLPTWMTKITFQAGYVRTRLHPAAEANSPLALSSPATVEVYHCPSPCPDISSMAAVNDCNDLVGQNLPVACTAGALQCTCYEHVDSCRYTSTGCDCSYTLNPTPSDCH